MFSSRNIHFAILGIILGASSGYILAFYRAESAMKQSVPSASSSNVPQNHPEVSAGEILQMFELAIKRNPNEPELLSRYGSFLFSLGRPSDAVEWFQKALAIRPNDVPTLEALFDAQLDGLLDLKGAGTTLQKIEKMEPQYGALPDLRKRYGEKSKTTK